VPGRRGVQALAAECDATRRVTVNGRTFLVPTDGLQVNFNIGPNGPITIACDHADIVGIQNLFGVVPEPATWAMMLTGFFGLGAVLRRQRSALA
jgi:hypothetical protein